MILRYRTKDEMPWPLNNNILPYIKEAMSVFAAQ
jgi:hypothetical protein